MRTVSILLLICFSVAFGDFFDNMREFFNPHQSVDGTSTMILTLRNTRDYPISFQILKGDLYETRNVINNTQNFAVSKDYDITLGPNEEKQVEIEIMCINQDKNAALNEPVLPTPLQTSNRFQSQEDLWNRMRELRR